jgi:predicted DNA-binding transcriptional regulator YafY
METTAARLLRLLSLLQSRREWTGRELAGRLEVSGRTVRHDIQRLRELGYPVDATRGAAGGYRLGVGAALPPLLLDDDEAVAVAVGLRTAAGGTVSGIAETSVRALTKLEQMLPSRLRRRVEALQSATVPIHGPEPTVDPDTLTTVAVAISDQQRLRFDYRSHDGTTGRRSVEPYRLVHTGRRWYLVAWDIDRAGWRTFRVDRLQPRAPTGPGFEPREPPDPDIVGYTAHNITTGVYRYQARITLHGPAEAVAQRITPTIGTIEAIDGQTCTLRTGANSLDDLAAWVAVIGFDFQVHEPPELIDHLDIVIRRLSRARQTSAQHHRKGGRTMRAEGV